VSAPKEAWWQRLEGYAVSAAAASLCSTEAGRMVLGSAMIEQEARRQGEETVADVRFRPGAVRIRAAFRYTAASADELRPRERSCSPRVLKFFPW